MKQLTDKQKEAVAGGIDKRRVVVPIPADAIVKLIAAHGNGEMMALNLTGLPKGFKISSWVMDTKRDLIAVIISHESFDWVEEACSPPMIQCKIEYVKVQAVPVEEPKVKTEAGKTDAATSSGEARSG